MGIIAKSRPNHGQITDTRVQINRTRQYRRQALLESTAAYDKEKLDLLLLGSNESIRLTIHISLGNRHGQLAQTQRYYPQREKENFQKPYPVM
jgi:hypothetical protein